MLERRARSSSRKWQALAEPLARIDAQVCGSSESPRSIDKDSVRADGNYLLDQRDAWE